MDERLPELEDGTLRDWYTRSNAEKEGDVDLAQEHPRLVSRLAALRTGTVVDLGCNRSPFTFTLAAAYPHLRIIGIDDDATALRLAERERDRRLLDNLSFNRIDSTATDEMDALLKSVDVVACIQTLHHLPLEPTLKNIYGALKEGGTFYFRDFEREQAGELHEKTILEGEEAPLAEAIRALRAHGDTAFLDAMRTLPVIGTADEEARRLAILRTCSVLAAYTKEQLERALTAAGFTGITVRHVGDELEGIARKE